MMKTLAFGLALALVLVGVVTCSSDDEELVRETSTATATPTATPTASPSPVEPTSSLPPTPLPANFDDLMRDIETDVPGFAGMLLDPVDQNILLVKTTQTGTDVAALRTAIVARFPEMTSKTIELINATYDFAQLSEWYTLIDPLYGVPGLVTTDVDEVRNKIVIGVETEADRAPMEQKIAELPIPPDAIEVRVTGPVVLD